MKRVRVQSVGREYVKTKRRECCDTRSYIHCLRQYVNNTVRWNIARLFENRRQIRSSRLLNASRPRRGVGEIYGETRAAKGAARSGEKERERAAVVITRRASLERVYEARNVQRACIGTGVGAR